jgi:UDP-N-acetylglucosamine 2-epimerase (non-hydrolysing)
LLSEGFRKDHVFVTGSPLNEVLIKHSDSISKSNVLLDCKVESRKYFVVSAHREENVDIISNFIGLMNSLNKVAEKYNLPIIFSAHPRTLKKINEFSINFNPLIRIVSPLGFFDYVYLQQNAYCVLSDSGTISEESAMMNFPAISIRTSTERPEAIDFGSIVLGGITENEILNAIETCLKTDDNSPLDIPFEYKINNVSKRVIRVIQSYTSIINRVTWNKI